MFAISSSIRLGHASRLPSRSRALHSLACLLVVFFIGVTSAFAQTGGEAGIQGTVTDPTGAAIPGATVTATDNASGVATTRTSTSDGLYTISPIPPGIYTVKVTAPGFSSYVQNNLHADALVLTGLNVTMKVGSTDTSVTVTEAPPPLDTTNAQLGLTIENDTYTQLPIIMNGAQRDPTAFATLTPGAQGGARLPIIGGSGNYLGQLYLEGLPAETVSQQGDNRLVSLSVDLDAVDQFQVVTSTPAAEYSGAGAENFTMKSGGNQYHGSVNEYVRNTIFDAWSFTAKAATTKNAAGQTVPAGKPIEHQNEFSVTFGGHVPFDKKMFFFVAYDRFHYRKGVTPSLYTIPTTLETQGDFTELNGNPGSGETGTGTSNPAFLFDPTTTTCNPTCTRQPLMGLKNGIPTYNVIPSNYISPIAQKMQSFLPTPTNSASLTNNFLGGQPAGFDNQVFDYRYDWDISEKNRISTVGAVGVENYVNNFAAPFLPLPYTGGDLAVVHPKNFLIEDRYTINNSMVNQLKFGFVRFYQNIHDATQNVAAYSPTTLGITNLPQGQGGQEFPGAAFTATPFFGNAIQGWTTNSNSIATQLTTPNNFTLVDNFQWVKGRHSITAGIQIQWQEINNANPATYTGVLDLTYNAYSTANFVGSSLTQGTAPTTTPTVTPGTPNGYAYASYLLGAVGGTPSIGLQPVSEEGGRYLPIAPYVEDSYKVTPKLTLDMGLRWDYLPPYHEVKDRWTYLNPTQTNSATGTPGQLEFAGNYGGAGVSCGCRTPVQTYWKNWGPRVGIAYQMDAKTVFRLGAGRVYSQGGGVGGRGGAFAGTGQTGFNTTATGPSEITTGPAAGPSFYLNNSAYFTQVGLANTSLFGAGYSYPTAPAPGPAAQILNTGYYLNSAGKFVTASGVSYADPYFSGRAPDFNFYNAGFERAITSNMTLAVNYVGNESHHLENSTNSGVGTARGYWSNQINPIYLTGLGGATATTSTGTIALLDAPATAANVAKAASIMGSAINIPAFFQAAAAVNSTATIAQGLVAFPQYSGVTDTWGQNVGNFSYNSLQITLQQRTSHGLSFNINYTYSKNIGDDGTFRNGFAIPAGAVSRNSQSWAMDRIDRSWTTVSGPQVVNAFGAYQLPFGTGHLGGGQNFFVRQLISGWSLSGIYTYGSGTPIAVTSTLCNSTNSPLQGQCMPDLATTTPGSARQNGSYGSGPNGFTAANLGNVQYFKNSAFQAPQQTAAGIYLIGNAPRTRPLNLNGPGSQNLNAAVKRSIKLYKNVNFQFEADASNVWNKVQFSNPTSTWTPTAATFGQITGIANAPRDIQFAGHINF
jgi:hypothetical protein